MNNPLNALSQGIARRLLESGQHRAAEEQQTFPRLALANADLDRRFLAPKKVPPPLPEKIRQAIARFRSNQTLTRQEWRLVLSGLAYTEDGSGILLDDTTLFARVLEQLRGSRNADSFRRREWFSLCYSYFSYAGDNPQQNTQWLALRREIVDGYSVICSQERREKEWMRIVDANRELFTDDAGKQLGAQMFQGKIRNLEHLQVIAQIPDSSWLWSRIMTMVCQQVERLGDDELLTHLPTLIDIANAYPIYRDRLYSACLTRYSNSGHRHAPHDRLKTATFEAWGNPQLRSKSNLWHHHVDDTVCQMVMSWFARQDLEHFFSLLQGTAQVDKARLAYWLRFVNQMSYTRIVIGRDAQTNSSPDYIQFRANNKGRLALLDGGTSADNAVVMQIGAYYFVEFSRTGNACYVHNAGIPAFNPEQRHLHLSTDLKTGKRDVFVSKHNHMSTWQSTFDSVLARLGIYPDHHASTANPALRPPSNRPIGAPLPGRSPIPQTPRPASTPIAPRIPTPKEQNEEKEFMAELHEALKGVDHYFKDSRDKGGGIHVHLTMLNFGVSKKLQLLGFQKDYKDPMHYWRPK